MEKKYDWSNLPFDYSVTPWRFIAKYKDGAWDDGTLSDDPVCHISECSTVIQYSQTCFDGFKAYRTKDDKVVIFRMDLNEERFENSSKRLGIPVFPKEKFMKAVIQVVKANIDLVPPYESGATLYVRPVVYGTSACLGVHPAEEYELRIFVMPVGSYYSDGIKPISLCVSDYDRAAPRGTGDIKSGLNYAMSLYAGLLAHEAGFAENLYLDPATRTKVEEAGGANILFITKDGKFVTPKSTSILPSVTRRSLVYVAQHYLNMEVEERTVLFDEVESFEECSLCGTAAVLSPVGRIVAGDKEILFPTGMETVGPVVKKLYDTLIGIQRGTIPAPDGWLFEVEG